MSGNEVKVLGFNFCWNFLNANNRKTDDLNYR